MSNSTNQTAASANGSAALAVRNSSPTSTRLNEQYQLNHLADEINQLHMECCRAAGDAATRAIAAGDLLLQAKAACKHGEWSEWLKTHFLGSDRTARVYMRMAKHKSEIQTKMADAADFSNFTIAKVLESIAPKQEVVEPEPTEELADQQEHDEGIVLAVGDFDDIVDVAAASAKSAPKPEPIEAAAKHPLPNYLLSSTEHIEFIAEILAQIPDETWEESSYRGLAADLVSACNQLTAPLRIRDRTNDTLERLNRKTRASLIVAIDDRVLMLGEYLKCIGFYDEVASEFEALRVAIEEAVK